jgi:L-serine dehydratase
MVLRGLDAQGDVVTEETYFSIGGGFVLTAAELAAGKATDPGPPVPYPFETRPRCCAWRATRGGASP